MFDADSTEPFPWLPGRTVWLGLGQAALNLLFPVQCLGCRCKIDGPMQPLCDLCVRRLPRATPDEVWERLQQQAEPSPFTTATALWHFDKGGTLQRVHRGLKYGNRPVFGQRLGTLLATALPETLGVGAGAIDTAIDAGVDAIVPIPLHRQRYLSRGYNQSTALAKGIAASLGAPVDEDLLVRARSTRSQTRLTHAARRANVHGAFAVPDPTAIAGRSLLLVDDVVTTGATVLEAAEALAAHNPAALHVASLALA